MLARRLAFFATLAVFLLGGAVAFADMPQPWQMGFQEPATPVMERIDEFHDRLLWIITAITVFVLALLLIVIVRFNERANPKPSKTTHNTLIEVLWTAIPVLILLYIAFGPPFSSFQLIYYADRTDEPEMTLKAIGHQWYWSYEYPDHGNYTFDALLDQAATGDKRLLETDNHVVVPVDTNVRLLVTADDVIHAWAMPAFGVKLDAVPGRANETWFRVTRVGVFYGQCSELCGTGHGYMPIVVEAVSKQDFEAWIEKQQAAMHGDSPATAVAEIQGSN